MLRARVLHLVVLLTATVALPFAVGAAPAAAHKHPGAPVVAEPAIVYVQTSVLTKVSVVERSAGSSVTTPDQQTFSLGGGSGFVVNPDGTVVTVGRAIGNGGADVDTAVGDFEKQYGALKVPPDFVRTGFQDALGPTPHLRHGCFVTDASHSACVDFASPVVHVFPYVSNPSRDGLKATVLEPGPGGGDVAVLKVESRDGMPTVNLASSSATAVPFTVLGFTRPVTGQDRPATVVGHFKTGPGSRTIDPKQTKVGDLLARLGDGLAGGPLVNDEGRVIAIASRAGDQVDFKFVEAIRDRLGAAGVQPAQGPVDTTFAEAKGYFDAQHYTPAVTRLQEVLRLYPQHALAKSLLTVAVAKAGGPEDLHLREMQTMAAGGGRSPRFWLAVAAGALLLVGLVLAVVFRNRLRRRKPPAAPGRAAGRAPAAASKSVGAFPASKSAPQPQAGRAGPPADGVVTGTPVPAGSRSQGQMQVRMARDLSGAKPGFCTQCGKPLAAGHRFCGFCGTRVMA
ncbi:MAG TPA: trypsin-like peptidase domain-containing protein [Actinomycetota bacterium]|nr:trypsin-like peptidase domain-containing protein [Actinomycetota bacterium]